MNREIKFRAWDKEVKQLSEVRLDGYQLHNYLTQERYEVMQYTGLKDKNGTDVYEGDLMVVDGKRAEVVWLDSEASFKLKPEFEENHYYVMNYNGDEVVIGNKYEN